MAMTCPLLLSYQLWRPPDFHTSFPFRCGSGWCSCYRPQASPRCCVYLASTCSCLTWSALAGITCAALAPRQITATLLAPCSPSKGAPLQDQGILDAHPFELEGCGHAAKAAADDDGRVGLHCLDSCGCDRICNPNLWYKNVPATTPHDFDMAPIQQRACFGTKQFHDD